MSIATASPRCLRSQAKAAKKQRRKPNKLLPSRNINAPDSITLEEAANLINDTAGAMMVMQGLFRVSAPNVTLSCERIGAGVSTSDSLPPYRGSGGLYAVHGQDLFVGETMAVCSLIIQLLRI